MIPFFRAEEFVPLVVFERYGNQSVARFIDNRVVETAVKIRRFFGAPVTVNTWHHGGSLQYRGWRPATYYGHIIAGSEHCFGRALDCDVDGCTAEFVRSVILRHHTTFPHIRRIEADVSWLHFDLYATGEEEIQVFHPKE